MRRMLILPLLLAAAAMTVYLLLYPVGRPLFDLEVSLGEAVSDGVISPVEFDVPLPEEEYQLRKEEAAALVPVYLRLDGSVQPVIDTNLREYLLAQIQDSSFVYQVVDKISGMYDKGVFDLERVRLIYGGDEAVMVSDSSEDVITLATLHHLEEVRDDLTLTLRGGEISWSVIGTAVVLLTPNIVPDDGARGRAVDLALETVSPVDTTILPGDTLIPAGGIVTDQSLRMIEALRRSDSGSALPTGTRLLVGHVLLMAGLLLLGMMYVRDQMPGTWEESKRLLLLGVIWIISLGMTGLVWMLLRTRYSIVFGSLVTFGAALTSIFFGRRHATFFSILFALALGGAHSHPFTFVLVTVVSGTLAGHFVWDLRRRSSVPRSISSAAAGSLLAWMSMALLTWGGLWDYWLSTVLELLIAPVIGVGVATSVLLPFEKTFGVHTVLAIDEVKDRHHPLLKELSQKAMGTWQHSQAVADLASEAARAIGADADLAEAGGLFHDIGKMVAPDFFIENMQPGTDNPHEHMSALESASILISHVRDGVELARRHRLPDSLVRLIAQHHGDCTTRYFLEKAKAAAGGGTVDPSFFTYPGPRPETTEAAIVMMADTVSSAVQALQDFSPGKVSETVRMVIEEKDDDGQFDECHITRAQIRKVREVFLQVLKGRFHERVADYPHGSQETVGRSDSG